MCVVLFIACMYHSWYPRQFYCRCPKNDTCLIKHYWCHPCIVIRNCPQGDVPPEYPNKSLCRKSADDPDFSEQPLNYSREQGLQRLHLGLGGVKRGDQRPFCHITELQIESDRSGGPSTDLLGSSNPKKAHGCTNLFLSPRATLSLG